MNAQDSNRRPGGGSLRVVFKFGGTSVGTAPRFRTVVDIVKQTAQVGRVLVVVSAQGKVTRRLSNAIETFSTQHEGRSAVVERLITDLRDRHLSQAQRVLTDAGLRTYHDIVEDHLDGLRDVFVKVAREGFSPAARDAILATGEQLSVPMLTLALRDAGLNAPSCDATALVLTDDTFGEANVLRRATTDRVQNWYNELPTDAVPVLAGFIGATVNGLTTTLGFEGSDYSASLFAQNLEAESVTRYTDVDGLYTEDPSSSETAEHLDELSLEEAYARTESGRLGMHPRTLRPLAESGIPMQVRSIDDPGGRGTRIVPDAVKDVRFTPPIGSVVPAETSDSVR